MNGKTEAKVIMVGERFFHSYKNKRIQTAWSLAGAKLFLDGSTSGENINEYLSVLKKKRYKTEVKLVKVI